MNFKRIIGIAIIVCGVALIGGAAYIQILIDEGKGQILEAQKKLDEGTGLLNIHPLSRRYSKNVTEKAQSKLDEATSVVQQYEQIALYALVGGGFLLIVGTALVVFSKKKKPSSKL